jgi:hypothetical protein
MNETLDRLRDDEAFRELGGHDRYFLSEAVRAYGNKSGEFWLESQAEWARFVGTNERSIRRLVKRAEQLGLIEVTVQSRGGKRANHLYQLAERFWSDDRPHLAASPPATSGRTEQYRWEQDTKDQIPKGPIGTYRGIDSLSENLPSPSSPTSSSKLSEPNTISDHRPDVADGEEDRKPSKDDLEWQAQQKHELVHAAYLDSLSLEKRLEFERKQQRLAQQVAELVAQEREAEYEYDDEDAA